MRGMMMLVAVADAERLHAALTYAAAGAAAGGAARIHLHESAVTLLVSPVAAPGDAARAQAGLPTLQQILDEALALGVIVTVCQSGLALAGLVLGEIDPRVEAQGPVGMLAGLGDDRLVIF